MILFIYGLLIGIAFEFLLARYSFKNNHKRYESKLRETGDNWREYQRKAVEHYKLQGEAEMLFRTIKFWQLFCKAEPTLRQEIKGVVEILIVSEAEQFAVKAIKLELDITHPFTYTRGANAIEGGSFKYTGESIDIIPAWLTDCINSSRTILREIYEEHNTTRLLERKER